MSAVDLPHQAQACVHPFTHTHTSTDPHSLCPYICRGNNNSPVHIIQRVCRLVEEYDRAHKHGQGTMSQRTSCYGTNEERIQLSLVEASEKNGKGRQE